jgi:hypothetical protein
MSCAFQIPVITNKDEITPPIVTARRRRLLEDLIWSAPVTFLGAIPSFAPTRHIKELT